MVSVFTKIIRGEIPNYKIYEDDLTYSFLAVPANQLGHTLIVSKQEIDYFLDVPQDLYLRVMKNVYIIAKAVDKVVSCQRVGTMIQGFEVLHFHCHIIPMKKPKDMDFSNARQRTPKEMQDIQRKIVACLNV